MHLIDCRQITCRYGPVTALSDFSFNAEEGSWTTVVGPSGSGKTTLLRALAGLESLVSGEIVLSGELASNHRLRRAPHERAIGMMFQEPSLWPHLGAAANVELALPASMPRRARADDARAWLERVGTGALAVRLPGELSGGEARRVTLARTLAARPRILLLDEPAAHLDLHLRGELLGLVRRLHAELGLTTICVTHQPEPPLGGAERVVVLDGGKKIFDGNFGGLAQAPETPYVTALRRWIRRMEDWTE